MMATEAERLKILDFCTAEIVRQRDTGDGMAIFGLIDAWVYAISQYDIFAKAHMDPRLDVSLILELGRLAKPMENHGGFRRHPIRIGWEVRDNHHEIPRQILNMVNAYNQGDLSPQDLYLEYEHIHPFGDGNGRTGKILFNWANGTLRDPQMPDNPFNWEIP
jgi:hypothetical protein